MGHDRFDRSGCAGACSSDEPEMPEVSQGGVENPLNLTPIQAQWVNNLNRYSLELSKEVISRATPGENFFVSTLDLMNMYSNLHEFGGLTPYLNVDSERRWTVFGPMGVDYGIYALTTKLKDYMTATSEDGRNSCMYSGSVWADKSIDRSGNDTFAGYLKWVAKSKTYDFFERPQTNEALASDVDGWLQKKNGAGCQSFGPIDASQGVFHALAADFHMVLKDAMTTDESDRDIFYIDNNNQTPVRPLITEHGYLVDSKRNTRWSIVTAYELEDDRYIMYSATPDKGISAAELAMSITDDDLAIWFGKINNPDNRCVTLTPPFDVDLTTSHFTPTQIGRLGLFEIRYPRYVAQNPDMTYSASQNVHASLSGGSGNLKIYEDHQAGIFIPFVVLVVEKSTNALLLLGIVNQVSTSL